MTESQEQKTTKYSAKKRLPRSLYLKQRREITLSRLREYLSLPESLELAMPIEDVISSKVKVRFRCRCGTEFFARLQDVFKTKQRYCLHCALRERMLKFVASDQWTEHREKMRLGALAANKKTPEFLRLRKVCNSVKDRCVNARSHAYKHYGGRGIKFDFPSPLAMAEWIAQNLGIPKESGLSIDRIDNNGNYAPGNIRWATAKQQGQNKRPYKVDAYGARVRKLKALRPDYSEPTIRTLIKMGLSDEEIQKRVKWYGCGIYVRHS